jgi:hypothetical protein
MAAQYINLSEEGMLLPNPYEPIARTERTALRQFTVSKGSSDAACGSFG